MIQLSRRHALVGGAAALSLAGAAAAALPVPPSGNIVFKVFREGAEIGHHSLTFTRSGDTLTVKIDVAIAVKIAFIQVFHYIHQNTETWNGDQFAGFDSETDDDGKHLTASARRQDSGILVQATDVVGYAAPSSALAATHWNKRQLDGPMINPQNGKLLHPTIAQDGAARVALADGHDVSARKYTLTGDMRLILWYDDKDAWTALSFTADDGSTIEYRLA